MPDSSIDPKTVHTFALRALQDAQLSRTLFQTTIDSQNPAPIPLRLHLKSFLYSIKEIYDHLYDLRSHPQYEKIRQRAYEDQQNHPLIRYILEARNTLAHARFEFITVTGGWTEIINKNPKIISAFDGHSLTMEPYRKWEHEPGRIILRHAETKKREIVPLPTPNDLEYDASKIAWMMEQTLEHFQGYVDDLARRLALHGKLP